MRLSLGVGFFMLASKIVAYWITGSAAILSDAAESVVHVVAVSFAAYSLWLSIKPPDHSHLYGHDKISFFSAGFEGAMIVMAAFYIIYVSVQKWMAGLKLEHLGLGTGLIVLASLINGALGFFLIAMGKKHRIPHPGGQRPSCVDRLLDEHRRCDWPNPGDVHRLAGVRSLGRHSGGAEYSVVGRKLIRRSIGGLMDEVDPAVEAQLKKLVDTLTGAVWSPVSWPATSQHGNTLWVEFHLLFRSGHGFGVRSRLGDEDRRGSGAAVDRADRGTYAFGNPGRPSADP